MIDSERKSIVSCTEKDQDKMVCQLVMAIGEESAFALMKNFGGLSIYIPRASTINRQSRNRRILEDFNKGISFREMSRKYGISDRTIREIVKNKK